MDAHAPTQVLDVVEVRPTDADLVAGIVSVENAVSAADAPWVHPTTPRAQVGRMRYGWDLEPPTWFVGLRGDRVVAYGSVGTSEWDNRDLAWLGVSVHPDERGAGVGTRLHAHLVDVARAAGRTKLGIDAWDATPGVAVAGRLGYARGSAAINRRQHLEEVVADTVRTLQEEARAAADGYELLTISGETPEDLMPAVAVMSAAINDAPTDDLDIEDEVFPPERIRNYERAQLLRGDRLHRLVARHRASGELAGHTVVAVDGERPTQGHQHDTSVVRAHRGHRLGLLLKTAMVLLLAEEEPQLTTVDTWNAESNDHMIAVNELLGYRWMGRELQFMRPLQGGGGSGG